MTILLTHKNDNAIGSVRQSLTGATDGDTIDATDISGVITLTTGQLLVDKSVIINGAGANVLAIDGNASSRVFQIGSGETVTISDVTIRNGQGNFGGGIFNGASAALTITNSILGGNVGGFGGGIFNLGTLQIGNTILKTGDSGENLYSNGDGGVTSLGYNISSDNGNGYLIGPGDQINTDPVLGPLQDNGGPTFTHELLQGSPAINAADPNFTPPPFFDQRGPGFNRVENGRLDIEIGRASCRERV